MYETYQLKQLKKQPEKKSDLNELKIDYSSMWLGSSVDEALHQYPKVMGLNPVRSWIFFRLLFQLLKLIAHCENYKFYSKKQIVGNVPIVTFTITV